MSTKNSAPLPSPSRLSFEEIAYYQAKGRQARSDAIVGGLIRGIKALRRRFERDDRASTGAYRLTWKAR